MTRFLTSIFLLVALTVGAADSQRITLTITVTNPPVTGYSLTVNSSTRIWTNQTTATFITTNSTVNNSATNLFLHIAATPFGSPRLILQWANTNQIKLIGQLDQVITATTNGLWATLTLSTQSGPTTINAVYPFANIVGDTNRTNQASEFVKGMGTYSTNAWKSNDFAVQGLLVRGIPIGGSQTVTGATVFHKVSGTNNGTIFGGRLQDQTVSNQIVHSLKFHLFDGVGNTNAGIRFFNSSTNLGSYINQDANGYPTLVAAGGGALDISADPDDLHLLNFLSARQIFPNRIPFGSTYSNYWTTTNWHEGYQYFTSGFTVATPIMTGGSWSNAALQNWNFTNAAIRGTNAIHGRLEYQAAVNVNLANGNNTGLLLGTNVYVRLVGSSASTTNGGFVAEPAGSYHLIQITNPAPPVVIVNDALDGTAANRILTGTGADLLFTNNPVMLQVIYDGAASRWRVISPSRSQ